MDWTIIIGIGTVISVIILFVGVAITVMELDHMARDRYVTATNTLLQIWESPEFQCAQLWILYQLEPMSWEEFIATTGENTESRRSSPWEAFTTTSER